MFPSQKLDLLADRLSQALTRPFMMWAVVALTLISKLLASSSVDPDLFARVAMGRLTLNQNHVPLTDPFAFTQVLPHWIDHEWLSGVVFYLTARYAGDTGFIALKLILATLSLGLVIHVSTLVKDDFKGRYLWIALCALHAVSAWSSTVRCQAFTYLFLPLLYLAIVEHKEFGRSFLLSLSPLLAIPWVNMHGGYALGVCVLGLYCVFARGRRALPLLVLGAWCLAPAATPYGFSQFSLYLIHALSMRRPTITEWMPLWSEPSSLVATVVLMAPVIYGAVNRGRRNDLFYGAIMVLSGYCAFRHIRFLPFFMLTLACFGVTQVQVCASRLSSRFGRVSALLARATALSVAVVTIVVSAQLSAALTRPETYRLSYRDLPVGAIEWLRASGRTGKLLVTFNSGSFALWRLYPRFKVSIDGRYEETYPTQTFLDVGLAFRPDLPEGKKALQRVAPTYILAESSMIAPSKVDLFGTGWREIYRDDTASILTSVPGQEGLVDSTLSPTHRPVDPWTALF